MSKRFAGFAGAIAVAAAGLVLAQMGQAAVAIICFVAAVVGLSLLLVSLNKMTLREAIYLWGGLGVLAVVYAVILFFPMQVMSRVVDEAMTPIPNLPVKLVDSNGMPREVKTGPNGESFVAWNVPAGKFSISADGQVLTERTVQSWWDRIIHFNVIDVGDLVLHPAVDEVTPLPPTETPVAVTITPTATEPAALTNTPTLPPPTWKTNLLDQAEVAQKETLIVTYTGNLDGYLWVFVMNQNGGQYYPQSPDPCRGESIFHWGNQWETRVGFGSLDTSNTGLKFDLVLAVAKTYMDNQYIAGTLISWCNANNFPGFVQLPGEVQEVHRVRGLTRKPDLYGRAPSVTNARVPGEVNIASLPDGSMVRDMVELSGSYSGLDSSSTIWVLVYPEYGAWFPQTMQDARKCEVRRAITDTNKQTWHVPVLFGSGGAGIFDIVAAVANSDADKNLMDWQTVWCRSGNYFGFRTIELPAGIEEKDRIRVKQ